MYRIFIGRRYYSHRKYRIYNNTFNIYHELPEGMESSLLVFACADLIVPTMAKNITIVAIKGCFDFEKSDEGNFDLNIEGACGGLFLTR